MAVKNIQNSVKKLHLLRARWVANLLDKVPEDSGAAREIAEWFIGNYHSKGYEWLNIGLPSNFPRSEVINKRDVERAEKYDDAENLAWMRDGDYRGLKTNDRRIRRTQILKALMASRINQRSADEVQTTFDSNLNLIGDKLELSHIDRDYLMLLASIEESKASEKLVDIAINYFDVTGSRKPYDDAISAILNYKTSDISASLAEQSALNKSGLISLAPPSVKFRFINFYTAVDITIARFFSQILNHAALREDNFQKLIFGTKADTRLSADDFAYMADKLDMAVRFVKAVDDGIWTQGSAVVLEGDPGVGKSQMVGVISKMTGTPYYYLGQSKGDIRRADQATDTEMTRKEVLAELRFKNRVAERLNLKVGFIMEESDSILRSMYTQESDKTSKGHINMVLEELRRPIIFTTNTIDEMERATIRRILPVIPVELQPDHVLAALMIRVCGEKNIRLTENEALNLIEQHSGMSIGEIERITQIVCVGTSEKDTRESFLMRLDMALRLGNRALNSGLQKPVSRTQIPDGYDPSLPALSLPYNSLCQAFVRSVQKNNSSQPPRLAMVGYAGAGKRSLARDLFSQAQLRVQEVTFSSLLGFTAYSQIIDLFQTAAASKKGLLVTGAQALLLNHETNRDFLFIQAMREFSIPIIMTADIIEGNKTVGYNYQSGVKEAERPRQVGIHSSVSISRMPISLRENFSLVVQFNPLQGRNLRRAYFTILGEDCDVLDKTFPKGVTLADLTCARRSLDFLAVTGAQRGESALTILQQICAPLLAGEHNILPEETRKVNGHAENVSLAPPKPH